jgi:hypothetical protein
MVEIVKVNVKTVSVKTDSGEVITLVPMSQIKRE